MTRIAEIAPDALTAEQAKIFDQLTAGRGRILAPYKVWIHSPTLASGMEHIMNTRCIDTLHCSLPAANCRIRISVRSRKFLAVPALPKCSSCSAIIPQLRSP